MSAIEPLGYPDWQRLTNWDGPVLWQPAPGAYNTDLVGPVMRVDRYNSLNVYAQLSVGKAILQFAWFTDQALTTPIGVRTIYLDAAGAGSVSTSIPNQAAWCQVTIMRVAGANYTIFYVLMAASNRQPVSLSSLRSPVMISVQNQSIAANGVFTASATFVIAGRGHLWLAGNNAKGFITLSAMNPVGVYDSIAETATDANNEANVDVELPQAPVRLTISNATAAAATFFAALVGNGR